MSTPQATDKVLVNRAGTNHQASADMSTVQDTDLILVNRGGVDYKCSAADWKKALGGGGGGGGALPDVGAVTVSDVAGGNRFTSTVFPVSATMTENGNPPSQKKLKAYVEGTLKKSASSSPIVAVQTLNEKWSTYVTHKITAGSESYISSAFQSPPKTAAGGPTDDGQEKWSIYDFSALGLTGDLQVYTVGYNGLLSLYHNDVFVGNIGDGGWTTVVSGAIGKIELRYGYGRPRWIFPSVQLNGTQLIDSSFVLLQVNDSSGFDEFVVGDVVRRVNPDGSLGGTAILIAKDQTNKTLKLANASDTWTVGSSVKGPLKTVMVTPETDNITQVTQTGSVFIERQGPSMQERRAVAWGNGRFVVISSLTANQATLTSTNGEDWTAGSLGGSLGDGREIAYGNGYFVAVGTGGMRRSADGLSWETGTNPVGPTNSFQYFAEHSQFLACKHDGNVVGVYKDNNTWTTATLSDSSSRPWQAALNPIFGTNGRYVLTCAGTSQWYYSDDRAVSWNVMTGPGTPPSGAFWTEWRNVVYSSKLGKFFSYSFNAQASRFWTASSSNGITWTVVEHNNVGGPMEAYAYRWVPELERIMSIRGDGSFYSTADGYTWNTSARCSAATASAWYGWAYSPTLNKTVAFPVSGNNTAMNVATGAGFAEHTLTFDSTAGLTQFAAGSTATLKDGGASGKVGVVSTTPTPKMSITDTTGTWTTGKTVTGTPVASSSVRLYAKLDANQNVTDLQSADPGFNTWNPQTVNPFNGHITFPATLPTGNTPDVDLPAGTALTVQVQASNDHGTDTATSNTITPA